jgi:hypothetical protein
VPANDNFADAVVLAGTNVTVGGDNSMATSEPGEPNHTGGAPGGHSVWYTWTAPARGVVTIGATGTDFTPVVASYTGTNISNLARLGTNSANGVSFVATAGAVYDIAVDGSGGFFTLNLSLTLPPGNDDFGSRFVLSGMSPGVEGSAFLATFEPGEPGFYPWVVDRSVWYSWIAPADGAVRVHCPSRPIAAYSGNCISNLTVVASVNAANFADLTFTAITGTEYEVAVAGAWWLPDDFTLSLQEAKVQIVSPTNGAVFSPPVDIDIVARTIDLEGAVRTVAFFDGTNLLANVTNAPFRMTYARPSVGSHLLSAQATDENGLVTTSGTDEVRVKPPNDDFAQRTAISGDSITFAAANDGATSEPGESLPAGATGRTLWWSWTAPSNGTVTITATAFTNGGSLAAASKNVQSTSKQPTPASTNASQAHAPKSVIIIEPPGPPGPPGPMQGPLIAVYKGSSVASLSLCASNTVCYYSGIIIIGQDPSCQWCVLPTVQFPVAAGETYQLSVDGVNGSMGRATIGFSFAPPAPPPEPPANDRFSQRLVLTGCSLDISGTTVNATREPGEPSHRTDAAARTVWYSWTAPVSGTVQLETMETSEYALAPALALGIYAGSSLWNLIPVTTGFSSVAFYALAGTTYQIAIAGPSGLETGFDLTLNAPPPPPSLDPTNTVRLRNGTYRVRVTGVLGQSFVVQASSNSRDWATIRTDTLLGPYLDFIDTTASRYGQRFYRVLPLDAAFDQRPFRIMASSPDTHAGFPLRLAGISGQPFRLQASTNLLDWIELTSGILVNETFDFTDGDTTRFDRRFYRALKQ